MKKVVAYFALIILFSTFLLGGCGFFGNRTDTLKILNFADYLDLSLLDDFKEYYFDKYGRNLNIVYDTSNANENIYTKISKGKEDWDLVCVSDYTMQKMKREGLLLPLDASLLTNYGNVSPFIKDSYQILQENAPGDNNIYSVDYMWGTMGIFYNSDYVDANDVLDWSVLWNKDYAGKIYMKDSVRDTVAAAVLYLRQDEFLNLPVNNFDDVETRNARQNLFNDLDPEFIDEIEQALRQQKIDLKVKYDIDFDKDEMATGKAYLDVAWSGDVAWAIMQASKGVNLGYSIPLEGSNLWFDGWCVPKYSKNPTAATEFVNFVLNEDNAIANMEDTGYTSCVSTPKVLEWAENNWQENAGYYNQNLYSANTAIDVSYFFDNADSVCVNPVMYPPASDISRCMIMNEYSKDTNDKVLKMWTQVKGGMPEYVYYALSAFLVVLIGLIIYFVVKNKRTNKKNK